MPDAARRAEIARRWRAGEAVAHLLDEEQRAVEDAFRASLADEGPAGAELLRRYDARVRDVESGVYGARMCWHSLSPAQRRVCLFLAHGHSIRMPEGRVLVRSVRVAGYYDAEGTAPGLDTIARAARLDTIARAARLDTVRALARHGLVAWDGTAFDPEARAVATERMRFVAEYGQATP